METNSGQPSMFDNTNTNMQIDNNYHGNAYDPRPVTQVAQHRQFYSRNTDLCQYRCTNCYNNIMNNFFMAPNHVNVHHYQQQYYPSQVPPGHINGGPVDDDDGYFDSMPPGFRFCPYDSELIVFYLKRKLMNQPLPRNRIHVVQLYEHHPQELAGMYKLDRENSWYFFTSRKKKYPNGSRPNRSAGNGYWKPTGTDKVIISDDKSPIGYRTSLDYYEGKQPRGKKTDWKMHEYRTTDQDKNDASNNKRSMKLNDHVLCRLYKKNDKKKKNDEDGEDSITGPLVSFQNDSSQQKANQLDVSDYPQENDFGGSSSFNNNVLDNHANHQVADQFGTSSNHGSLVIDESRNLATMNYVAPGETSFVVPQYGAVGTSTSTEWVNISLTGPISATQSLTAAGLVKNKHLQMTLEDHPHAIPSHVIEGTNSTESANNVAVAGPCSTASMPQMDVVNNEKPDNYFSLLDDHTDIPAPAHYRQDNPVDFLSNLSDFGEKNNPFDDGLDDGGFWGDCYYAKEDEIIH